MAGREQGPPLVFWPTQWLAPSFLERWLLVLLHTRNH